MLVLEEHNAKQKIVTPILSNKKKSIQMSMNDDMSMTATPQRLTHRVSFVDSPDNLLSLDQPEHRRNFSLQYPESAKKKITFMHQPRSAHRKLSIPPFIPDDPEKPHLSSAKKEKERR